MLPNLPILQRIPYKSGLTGASYNPRTLITRLSEPDFISSEFSADVSQMYEYTATHIHEQVHWLQHHNTSFGCFLELLRFSQIQTTIRFLRNMPSNEVQALLSRRKNGLKKLLTIDQKTQFPILEQSSDNYELNMFRLIWFNHQWLHLVLEDSRVLENGLALIPGSEVENIIADVIFLTEYELGSSPYGQNADHFLKAREWFSIHNNEMGVVLAEKQHLTSRILMEFSATISEIQLFRGSFDLLSIAVGESDLGKILEDRLTRILEGSYGLPIRILLKEMDIRKDRFFDFLQTANLICFIALNPPLPPYSISPPKHMRSWRWHDIYPPIRFMRLAKNIKKIGILKNWQEHNSIWDYISRACDASRISHVINADYPESLRQSKNPNYSENGSASPTLSSPQKGYYADYILWVQSQMAQYRFSSLPLAFSLGDCFSGDLAVEHFRGLMYHDVNKISCLHSPFIWNKNGKIGFRAPRELGNKLLQEVVFNYAAFDLVVGDGEYDLNAFPDEISQSQGFRDFLDGCFNHVMTQSTNT